MIQLTRINGVSFVLNSDLIEFIEATPDTLITTVHGTKVLVCESTEQIVQRIIEFRRRIVDNIPPSRPLGRV